MAKKKTDEEYTPKSNFKVAAEYLSNGKYTPTNALDYARQQANQGFLDYKDKLNATAQQYGYNWESTASMANMGNANYWKSAYDAASYNRYGSQLESAQKTLDTAKWYQFGKKSDAAQQIREANEKQVKMQDDYVASNYKTVSKYDDLRKASDFAKNSGWGDVSELTKKLEGDIGKNYNNRFLPRYSNLDEDELALMNYLNNTQGSDAAIDYLKEISSAVQQRRGSQIYEKVDNWTDNSNVFESAIEGIGKTALNVMGGDERFQRSLGGAFTNATVDTKGAHTYAGEMAQKTAATDMERYIYQAADNLGDNMPSMILGTLMGPAGGAHIGAALMGISAGGNAKQEALAKGHEPFIANAYGIVTGAIETLTGELLSGIPGVGGILSGKALEKLLPRIAKPAIRYLATIGVSEISENIEEQLNNIFEDVAKKIILHESVTTEEFTQEAIDTLIVTTLSTLFTGGLSGGINTFNETRSFNHNNVSEGYKGMDTDALNYVKGIKDLKGYEQRIADSASARMNSEGSINNWQMTRLEQIATEHNKDALTSAVKGEFESAGIGNAEKLADLYVRRAAKEDLGFRDSRTLKKALKDSKTAEKMNSIFNETRRMAFGEQEESAATFTKDMEKPLARVHAENFRAENNIKNEEYSFEVDGKTVTGKTSSLVYGKDGVKVRFAPSDGGEVMTTEYAALSEKQQELFNKLENGYEVNGRTVPGLGTQAAVAAFNNYKGQELNSYIADAYAVMALGYSTKASETKTQYIAAAEQRLGTQAVADITEAARAMKSEWDSTHARGADTAEFSEGSVSFEGGQGLMKLDTAEFRKQYGTDAANRLDTYVNILSEFAKATRLHIILGQSPTKGNDIVGGTQGAYVGNRTIYLDAFAGINDVSKATETALLVTASHELTHFLRQNDREAYNEVMNFVFEKIADSGQLYDVLHKNMYGSKAAKAAGAKAEAKAKKAGKSAQEIKEARFKAQLDYAMEEVVAKGCEDMLGNMAQSKEFAKKHPAAYGKLKAWLEKWIDTIKSYPWSKSREATIMREHLDGLLDRWSKGFERGVFNEDSADYVIEEDAAEVFAEVKNEEELRAAVDRIEKPEVPKAPVESKPKARAVERTAAVEKPAARPVNNRKVDAKWAAFEGKLSERDEVREIEETDTHYSVREEAPPKKTMIGYKVFKIANGQLYPTKVKNPGGKGTPLGVWLNADTGELARDESGKLALNTLGRISVKADGGTLAWRPGWHLGALPEANQMNIANPNNKEGKKSQVGLMHENYVFCECEFAADIDYQLEAFQMGFNKNGKYTHKLAGLPYLPKDGYYRYRTNPDPNTSPWFISGAIKITRILDDAERKAIIDKYNAEHPDEPMYYAPRKGGDLNGEAFEKRFGIKLGEAAPSDVSGMPKGVDYSEEIKALEGYAPQPINWDNPAFRDAFDINKTPMTFEEARAKYESQAVYSERDSEYTEQLKALNDIRKSRGLTKAEQGEYNRLRTYVSPKDFEAITHEDEEFMKATTPDRDKAFYYGGRKYRLYGDTVMPSDVEERRQLMRSAESSAAERIKGGVPLSSGNYLTITTNRNNIIVQDTEKNREYYNSNVTHYTKNPAKPNTVYSLDHEHAVNETTVHFDERTVPENIKAISKVTGGSQYSGGGMVDIAIASIIDSQFAVEWMPKIRAVYEANNKTQFMGENVLDFDPTPYAGKLFHFHASTPCVGFSGMMNKQFKASRQDAKTDMQLAKKTASDLRVIKPMVFTLENVPGYKNSAELKEITKVLDELGYKWDGDVFNSADYGSATSRERYILRAVREGELPALPAKLEQRKGWYSTVSDLIGTADTPIATETNPRMLDSLRRQGIDLNNLKEPLLVFGESYKNGTFGHALGSQPMPTIIAKSGASKIFMPDGKVYDAKPRILARISGLPDSYTLPRAMTTARTIIGNGVPVELTQKIIGNLVTETAGMDVRFSERDTPKKKNKNPSGITQDDVYLLRSVGRKTVNEFTHEDIKKARKWANVMYAQLGVKSPFFRAWFGDWREYDTTPVVVSDIPEYIDTNEFRKARRGVYEVIDTRSSADEEDGWKVRVSKEGEGNTTAHSGGEKLSKYGYGNIPDLIRNAIYLDTEVHEHHSNNAKNDLIAFDQKLYSLGKSKAGGLGLYKITVEDTFQSKSNPNDFRFHNMHYIAMIEKIADIENKKDELVGSSPYQNKVDKSYTTKDSSSFEYSVKDVYGFVKQFDAEFKPKPADPGMLDENGTPKTSVIDGYEMYVSEGQQKAKDNYGTFDRDEADIHLSEREDIDRSDKQILDEAFDDSAKTAAEQTALRNYRDQVARYEEARQKLNEVGKGEDKAAIAAARKDFNREEKVLWGMVNNNRELRKVINEERKLTRSTLSKEMRSEFNDKYRDLREYDRLVQKAINSEAREDIKAAYELGKRTGVISQKFKDSKLLDNAGWDKHRAEQEIERLKKASAEAQAKLRADRDRKLAEQQQRFNISRQTASAKRKESKIRSKINDMIADLNRRLGKATIKSYVPQEHIPATIELLEILTSDNWQSEKKLLEIEAAIGMLKETDPKYSEKLEALNKQKALYEKRQTRFREKAAALKSIYDGYREAPEYRAAWDSSVSGMFDTLIKTVGETPISQMNESQLTMVYTTLKAMDTVIRYSVKMKIAGEERAAFEVARALMEESRDADKIEEGVLSQTAIDMIAPRVVFERFGGFKKNSTWAGMYELLDNGQLEQTRLTMEMLSGFDHLMKDEAALRRFTGRDRKNKLDPNAIYDIGLKDKDGNAVMVTADIAAGIYMDTLNEQNAKHLAEGGKIVPDLNKYYLRKGGFGQDEIHAVGFSEELARLGHELSEAKAERRKYEDKKSSEAYRKADEEVSRIKDEIADVKQQSLDYVASVKSKIEEVFDGDRFFWDWISAAQELFDVKSKEALNEVTMRIYGIKRAEVDHYFPIRTDPDFRAASFETVTQDMNLENVGFMKERINGANPTLALGITDVISDQIAKTAQYCGLMPAIKEFEKAYGKVASGYTDSVQKALKAEMGTYGAKYIDKLMGSLTGSRTAEKSPVSRFLAAVRGNVAATSLTLNPRVALSQAASYPTAAATIGWSALGKALKSKEEVDTSVIAKYSPLWWYRMQGYSTVELGDIKESNGRIAQLFRKLNWATGWIQAIDGATTKKLWLASEYYVRDTLKIAKGADGYYEEVARIYNKVIEETQPNYTTMQRPELLRNPSDIQKSLTMFMTQRLQNTSILVSAASRYNKYKSDLQDGKNGVTRDDVVLAKTELDRAVWSQIAAAGTIVVMKYLVNALMSTMNPYRDKDGDVTVSSTALEMLDQFVDTIVGNVWFGSQLYNFGKALTGREKLSEITVTGVDTINDFLDSVVKLGNDVAGGKKFMDIMSDARDVLVDGAGVCGLPINNAVKIAKAFGYFVEDLINGDFFTWEASSGRTKNQNAHRLYTAYLMGDTEKIKELTKELGGDKDAATKLKAQIKSEYTGGKLEYGDAVKQLIDILGMKVADANELIDYWELLKEHPDYSKIITQQQYTKYHKYVESTKLSIEDYTDALKKADADGNGSLKKSELQTYLNKLVAAGAMTRTQANAVLKSRGW